MNPNNLLVTADSANSIDWSAEAAAKLNGNPDMAPDDGRSILEKTGDFISGVPRWAALSGSSAIIGLANTVPLIANAVGGQGTMEYLSTLEWAEKMDNAFGSGYSMQEFYNAHSEGVELTGAIVGGLVPGGLAVKGARVAAGGLTPYISRMAAMESDHIIGKSAAWISGLVETSAKTRVLRNSYDALWRGENAINGILNPSRIRFMLASGAQLGAEAMVFEAGASLTQMHNPTYNDIKDLGDFTKHIITAGAFGGALGGLIGGPLWKSAKFLPTDDAAGLVTLRDTAQIIGAGERGALEIADYAQQLKSITPGTKAGVLIDDLMMSKDGMDAYIDAFAAHAPVSKQEAAKKTAAEWFTRRDTESGNAIKNEVLELAKAGNKSSTTNIGEDFLLGTIQDAQGKLKITADEASQLLDGMKSIRPLLADISAKGITVKSVNEIGDDALAEAYRLIDTHSEVARRMAPGFARLEELKDIAKNVLDFNIRAADDLLTPYGQAIKNEFKLLSRQVNTPEGRLLQEMYADPRAMTPAQARFLGIAPHRHKQIDELVRFENTASVNQIYDMVMRKFVEKPIATLGDLLEHPERLRTVGNVLQINGQRILKENLLKDLHSPRAPLTSIDSQIRWETVPKMATNKPNEIAYRTKEVDTFFSGNEVNPYRLAAALDNNLPIVQGGKVLTKEEALVELTRAKLKLYREGIDKNMSEIEARMYADLPLSEDLGGWAATKGRENNFLERRNVVVEYNKETPLNEFDMKTIAGMRKEIVGQQLALAERAFVIAESLNILIPDTIKAAYTKLREFGLNGAMPIDFAHAIGAGTITNANGRMFTLNTQATQFGTFLNDMISKQHDLIVRELAPEYQRILRGVTKNADLDQLRVLQTKIQGGGDKWYDAAALGLDGVEGEILYVNKEVAQLLLEGTPAAMRDARDIISLNSASSSFKINNPNLVGLLRKYSGLEGKFRTAAENIRSAKGYNVIDNIPGQLYFPPTDVTRSPYFAMVRSDADSATAGFSSYSFIHANSSKALSEKVQKIAQEFGNKLKVFRREDIEIDKKLQGEYEQAQSFYSYSIDSDLSSKGIFSEMLPRTGEEILEEMQKHLTSKATSVSRNLTNSMSGDFLGTLDRLSKSVDQYTKSTHGKAFGPGKKGVTPDNIYSQAAKAFLNLGPDENASGVLGSVIGIQNKVVDWSDSMADALSNLRVKSKTVSPKRLEEFEKRAADVAAEGERLGMNFAEMNAPILMDAEEKFGRGFRTRGMTQSLNSLSATLTLGLETMNAVVQSISLPITINSAIRQLVADAPPSIKQQIMGIATAPRAARAGAVATYEYWGNIRNVHLYQKLLNNESMTAEQLTKLTLWGDSKAGKFFVEMSDLGMIPPSTRQLMIEVGQLTNLENFTAQGLRQKLIKAAEIGTSLNRYAELFQRYAALRTADGIASAANLTGEARLNMLHSFATQANGVFTAAQRPGLFQGALGSSFGLYKSYSINLMQAMGRHIENRDYSALISLAAVQGTIFGARSLPGAEQLNSYILAQNKEDERDLYTTADIILGKGAGNALLYGLPSMFLGANMYSRGDLRPASLIGNPFSVESFPAVNQFVQAGKAVIGAYTKASQGAGIGNALTDAIAHQSLWRPGARAAEYVLGEQTSAQGKIVQHVDNSQGIFNWDLAVRLSGARPFDEAVLSDGYYRRLQYNTDKTKAMAGLNSATRLAIQQGKELDLEDTMDKFRDNGGNPREFRKWIRGRYKDMQVQEADRLRKQLLKSGKVNQAQQLDIPYEE